MLDIRWKDGVLGIAGTLEVLDGSITGRGFSLRQAQGRAVVNVVIPLGGPGNLLVDLRQLTARAESLAIQSPDVILDVFALSVADGAVLVRHRRERLRNRPA